jgi:hypothetical protein
VPIGLVGDLNLVTAQRGDDSGSAYRSLINVRGGPWASGRVPPPGRTGTLAACSTMLTVEVDTPSRAPTSRMVIPVSYSFPAWACNTSGDQADRGAKVPGRLVNPASATRRRRYSSLTPKCVAAWAIVMPCGW